MIFEKTKSWDKQVFWGRNSEKSFFQFLIVLLLDVLKTSWVYEKCSTSFGKSKKMQNEWLWCPEHTRILTQKWPKIEKLAFFGNFFFKIIAIFSPMRLQNENFYSKPKNSKTLNILEHFWYPGHLCSSKTKKIRGGSGGGTKSDKTAFFVVTYSTHPQ